MTIRRITNADPDFYRLLGPYLSRREIVAELGYPVWDEDGKTWLVDVTRGRVRGFVAYRTAEGKAILTSDYVLPDYRLRGVYRSLFAERMRLLDGVALTATVTKSAAAIYCAHGFVESRAYKNYTVFRRPA